MLGEQTNNILESLNAYDHVLAESAKRGTVQFPGDVGAPLP